MICDHVKGCICKEGGDCGGGQRLLDLTRAAPLDQDSSTSSSKSSTVAIVLSVLFLTLTTIVLIIVYYRRRMKRLQKDLKNRSVCYVENSILDGSRQHPNADMIITDHDPVEDSPDPILHTVFQAPNNLPNNAGAASTSVKLEKNVNIDRFKLGLDEASASGGASGACGGVGSGGACAIPDEESDDEMVPPSVADLPMPMKNTDVNVYEEDFSPSKEKNNFLLDNSRKINKPTVDLVFHRNNFSIPADDDDGKDEEQEEAPEDEIAIAKMTNYLNH